MVGRLAEFRRELHKIPEVGFDLPETRAYVKKVLEGLPCEITLIGPASLCAFFDAGRDETLAFRSDMDALPLVEENATEYKSLHEGKMHACGHDGHMAILLAFAEELAARLKELPRNALLIFQAAEETTGGALEICESGILARYGVERVYGLHLWPNRPAGEVVCRKNEFMARTCNISVGFHGKSTHAAYAERGIDALESGVRFVESAYAMEKGELPSDVFRLLKFGIFRSGTAVNVIAGHAVVEGTMRCFQPEVYDMMERRLHEIGESLREKTGCRVEIEFSQGYPALINGEGIFDDFREALAADATALPALSDGSRVGAFRLTEPEAPCMTGEDFSFYQQAVPGLFFHLGLGPGAPLHSGRFDFDEAVLRNGVEIYWRLLFLSGQTDDNVL
ncbi:MAG: amidohydrolase [Clostridiales Family XIII bacterium]|jgi:hippurate hydrolase|nr:amidohydrolase [Clostridiales Family XIII bacterium]